MIARDISIADRAQALRILLDWLAEQQPALQLTAAGHRIVPGGRLLHASIREAICKRNEWLGLALDTDANQLKHTRISRPDSPVQAWVIRTDEESVIARHSPHVLEQRTMR